MPCVPEHTKSLKFDCFTEPHIAFAFLNKSFATVPYFLIYMFEQQRFVFCNKRLQKMACSLNETRDELKGDISSFSFFIANFFYMSDLMYLLRTQIIFHNVQW